MTKIIHYGYKGFHRTLISFLITFPFIYDQFRKQNNIDDSIINNDPNQIKNEEIEVQSNSDEKNDQGLNEYEKIINNNNQNSNTQKTDITETQKDRTDSCYQINNQNQIGEDIVLSINSQQQSIEQRKKLLQTYKEKRFIGEGQKYLFFSQINKYNQYYYFKYELIYQFVEFSIKSLFLQQVDIQEYKTPEIQEIFSNLTKISIPQSKQLNFQQQRDINQFYENQEEEIKLEISANLSDSTASKYQDIKLSKFKHYSDYESRQENKAMTSIQINAKKQKDQLKFQQIEQQNNCENQQVTHKQSKIKESQNQVKFQQTNLSLIDNLYNEQQIEEQKNNLSKDQQIQPPQTNGNEQYHRTNIEIYENENQNENLKNQLFLKNSNQEQDHQKTDQILLQQENKINQAFQILDQKFYQRSYKKRNITDEILKKFVRDYQSVEQYLEEYNLNGTQEQLLKEQIQFFIPIRGDGNCLFTSLGFQYLYYNLIEDQRYQRMMNIIDQIEFKQNYEDQYVETVDEQETLRQELKQQLQRLVVIKNQQELLQQMTQFINNDDGPFYGLLIVFLRNYFRKILQDFYDTNEEMNFLIQNPDQIHEITTWEFMYDETDIALKLFAAQEQILVRCYQKMNVDDKIVQISEYKDDDEPQFQYKIGLAFQPGHYNAILLKN